MPQIIVNTDTLRLPSELRTKIETEQVLIRETEDGLLLTPYKQTGKIRARGMLRGSGFSTERFFEQKRADREMEV
jgi:virulence-associated protein VagC